MSLIVDNLSKSYPTRSGPLDILRGVQLAMDPGQALAILGPSGSGKSTLLHILGTLDQPTSGTVKLDNQDPFQLDERGLALFRNRHVGFIFQDHHLLPQCSVLENVLVPTLAAKGIEPGSYVQRARDLLHRVGLNERLDHRPAEISGGERQRVAIARALILRPQLLLADEPTGNLDRKTSLAVAQMLLEMHREEKTILIAVTHSLELAKLLPEQKEVVDGKLEAWTGGRS